ncbi:hypothetical protein [Pectinatus sottacetonis]|uniref:hypothetical protein n=1 Tax=Pectinatus sottacetonis TaxID=1002795 RepID=UPI0018C85BA0|nr:hypothetical protein [Pectinatus sottacetonis]
MNDEKIKAVYGKEQNIKIDIMHMINEGKDPYGIILYIAEYLEKKSGESGYADNIRECIHAVYGVGLDEQKPLSEELSEVQERCNKLEKSLTEVSSDDVKKRIKFAIEHHKKLAAFLEKKIKKANGI